MVQLMCMCPVLLRFNRYRMKSIAFQAWISAGWMNMASSLFLISSSLNQIPIESRANYSLDSVETLRNSFAIHFQPLNALPPRFHSLASVFSPPCLVSPTADDGVPYRQTAANELKWIKLKDWMKFIDLFGQYKKVKKKKKSRTNCHFQLVTFITIT